MKEMTLSEFISLTSASIKDNEWVIPIPNTGLTLFVSAVFSEFEAKEKAFHYLLDGIDRHNNKKNEDNPL
jgi:hypothetical protein